MKKFDENISKENLNALYQFLLEKNQQQKLLQSEIQVLKTKIKEREKNIQKFDQNFLVKGEKENDLNP